MSEHKLDFPHGRAKKGKVYAMDHLPGTSEEGRIIIMSEDTWGDFGTQMETMRRVLKSQDDRIKELNADIAARDIRHAGMLDKLEVYRELRRKELKPLIEAQVATLGLEVDSPVPTYLGNKT